MFNILLAALSFVSVSSFTACNTYRECESVDIGDKQFTCWGHESCTNSILTGTDSMPRYLDCDGDSACANATLDGFQYAYCHGKNSCANAKLSADHIECGGYGSCHAIQDTITTRNIYCQGSTSCAEIAINSGVSVNCNANKACFKSNVQSKDDIICNGIDSCSNTQLQSKMGEISCNGKAACRNSMLTAKEIKVYGHLSAAMSDLSADRIHGMGYYSLLYANIDSLDREEITVKMYGTLSGFGATMLCKSGAKCVLDCKSSGCYHMELVCLEGSECTVLPEDCVSNTEVDCPIVRDLPIEGSDGLVEYMKQKQRDGMELMELYVREDSDRLIERRGMNTYSAIFGSMLYSNILVSCVVFVVTLILSVVYYSIKYRDSAYKPI